KPPIRRIYIEIACRSDNVAAGFFAHDEWHRAQALAHIERDVEPGGGLVWRRNRCVPKVPQLTVRGRFPDCALMLARKRLQHRMRAGQRHRFNESALSRAHRPARAMNTTRSNRWTSCSFLSNAPCRGGMNALRSVLLSASGGMSSANNNFSQSRSSEVEGFFLRPGTSRKLKNTSSASCNNAFLSPGKCTSTICVIVTRSGNWM